VVARLAGATALADCRSRRQRRKRKNVEIFPENVGKQFFLKKCWIQHFLNTNVGALFFKKMLIHFFMKKC
jgi:hypothetical protein